MKGNCPNCPVQMDPPHIAINMTQVGHPTLFAYYCKWECANQDVSSVLGKMASGMTPSEYAVPEAQVQMPVYNKGTVWTAPEPFHQKVVEHTSTTALLAANFVVRIQDALKPKKTFGGVEVRDSKFFDQRQIIEFDEHLWLCPVAEWKMGGWRLMTIIAGPTRVMVRLHAVTDIYNLALDPDAFSLDEDFDRILAHLEVAVARCFDENQGGGIAKLLANPADEVTIQAQAIHVAGDPVPVEPAPINF